MTNENTSEANNSNDKFQNDRNCLNLDGRLTDNCRVAPSGKAIYFTVASAIGKGDTKRVSYIDVAILGGYAESFPNEKLVKGAKVSTYGRLRSSKDENNKVYYKDANGEFKEFSQVKSILIADSVFCIG